MTDHIARRLNKIERALDDYQEGEKLPISINDIYYVLGACDQLLKDLSRTQRAYQSDFQKLNAQVVKWQTEHKKVRKLVVRQDELITKYRQVIRQVMKMKRPTKSVKLELKSLAQIEPNPNW